MSTSLVPLESRF